VAELEAALSAELLQHLAGGLRRRRGASGLWRPRHER
jgi:hypothetical protein